VASFFVNDPPPFFKVPFSCAEIDPIKASLIATGFGDIDIAVVRIEKKTPSMAAFARAEVFGTPLIDQLRERQFDPDAMVNALTQALQRELGGAAGRMSRQAIVFSAHKTNRSRDARGTAAELLDHDQVAGITSQRL
jgi:hypothetical protein